MKPVKRIGLLTAGILVVVALVLIRKQDSEPQFEGQPLSYWLTQNISDFPRRNEKAMQALRGMGEPAVRQLTSMVERGFSTYQTFAFVCQQISVSG